jgi:nitrate/nitrite-specific signal transduction histidine kinase
MDAFETAKNNFLSSLNAQEAATLGTPHTAEDVLSEVRNAEENHRNKSIPRRYTKKIEPFLKGVEQYGKAIDVFVNVYPEVLSLIWGSARLILHVRRK